MFVDIDIIMRVFYEKYTYQKSINKGRMTTNQGAYASLVGISPFFSLSLGEELEDEIQKSGDCVDIPIV